MNIYFLDNSDELMIARLRQRSDQVTQVLVSRLTFYMLKLQKKIVTEKLQGQVLHHRSGTLGGSIVAHPAQLIGDTILGEVTGAGGPAFYGRMHERGGNKPYFIFPVTKKVLRFVIGDKTIFTNWAYRKAMPKRPFMAPSLEEMKAEIIAGIRSAATEALNG